MFPPAEKGCIRYHFLQKYSNGKVVEEDKEMEVVKADDSVPKLDAVGLALGAKLIQSKKAKRQLMDESYNR